MLFVSLTLFLTATGSEAAFVLREKGYVLEEQSIVGTVEDHRALLQKYKAVEVRAETAEETLRQIEEEIRAQSVEIAKAMENLTALQASIEKTYRQGVSAGRTQGAVAVGLLAIAVVLIANNN